MSWNFQIKDVSFAGSTITIDGPGGGATVTDFMDDANPVEFQDVEVSSVGVNCNGSMIRNAKPNVVMMSVTVIPNSLSDIGLYNMWRLFRVQGDYRPEWENPCSATITISGGRGSRHLTEGTMVSGPGGPSSNGEGKMQGRTYTFAFVKADL